MSRPSNVLAPDVHKQVFEERIVPESGIDQIKATDSPRAIILAGQPGAGKGGLASASLKEMDGNAVVIDTDACRDAHPNVEEFRKARPYGWAEDTHPDASAWAKELLGKAIEERKNFVFDTTLSDPGKAVALIEHLKDKGYQVEVRAVATSLVESELGVDQRFTGSVDRNGFGRFVPDTVRREIYEGLPKTLDTVAKELPDVPISVHNREGQKVFDNRTDDGSPGKALTDERDRRWVAPDILRGAAQGWSDQQSWHRAFPEQWQQNPKLDEATARNLLHERDQLKVVELVDRYAGATQRILQERSPDAQAPGRSPASQQPDPTAPSVDNEPKFKAKL